MSPPKPSVVTIERATYSGLSTLVANDSIGTLGWEERRSGADLLDLTEPTLARFRAAGGVVVTVRVSAEEPMSAGGSFSATLVLDVDGDAAETSESTLVSADPNAPAQVISLTLPYQVPVGAGVRVNVLNEDGANDVRFDLAAVVLRIA